MSDDPREAADADRPSPGSGGPSGSGGESVEDGGKSVEDGGGESDGRDAGESSPGAGVGLPGPLVEVLAEPGRGSERLPFLLGLLDEGDARVRLTAGTALCLVAEADPDVRSSVVRRLVDRLGEDAPVEVAHALDYLAARHPREVDETVAALADDVERRARERMYRTGAGFARSEYLTPGEGDRSVGRTRIPGAADADDPRRVYTNDGETSPHEVTASARDDAEDEEGDQTAREGADGDETGTESERESGDETGGDAEETDRSVTRGTLALVSKRLSAVVAASDFDELAVLSDRRRARHGDVYRSVGTVDGSERAVALTVFGLPGGDRRAFLAGVRDAMTDWAAVDDHEGIRGVYDWGLRPRPWAALEWTDETLADRASDPPVAWTVTRLGRAVAHAHQRGVVHGAVDPWNVVYRDTALTEDARRHPLVTNVGVAAAGGAARPGVGVDRRYAAPEHYDDEYGRVDHATDVYGLGAVLYRLSTGRHPHAGATDAAALRERVCSPGALDPTTVDPTAAGPDLPDGLADVVRKATATRKITRYEAVAHLVGDLRAVDGVGSD